MKVAQTVNRCASYDWTVGSFSVTPLTLHDVPNPSYLDCSCADVVTMLRKTSGPSSYQFSVQPITTILNTTVVFTPSATAFPHGISFTASDGQVSGSILLQYETLQTLYGMNPQFYGRGGVLLQAATGAQGTVHVDSKTHLFGLQCTDCINVESPNFFDCGSTSTHISYIPAGVKLKQGSRIGYVVDPWYGYGGLSVQMTSGNGAFSTTDSIAVSLPGPSMMTPELSLYSSLNGTIFWDSAAVGLDSTNYPTVTVTSNGVCTYSFGSYMDFTATISGVTGATATVFSYGGTVYGFVTLGGTACTSPQVTLSPNGGTCTTLPVVVVKCARRVEAISSSITVMLASPTATKVCKYTAFFFLI